MLKYTNVSSYSIDYDWTNKVTTYDIKCNSDLPTESNESSTFVLFETSSKDALYHWIYESFFFLLKYYRDLDTSFKVHLQTKKDFKIYFLIKLGLSLDSIHIGDLPKINECLVLPCITMFDDQQANKAFDCLPEFYKYLGDFNPDKTIDLLVMPRQSKENFASNDRVYRGVYEIYETLKSEFNNNVIELLETDKITDLNYQIDKVRRSKVVLLTYGSPLFLNGLIAENSHIICCGIVEGQYKFASIQQTTNVIKSKNQLTILPGDQDFRMYLNTIRSILVSKT